MKRLRKTVNKYRHDRQLTVGETHCHASGKIGHSSRSSAKRHLRYLERVRVGYVGNVYHCSQCLHWHVGRVGGTVGAKRGDGRSE